MALPSQFMKNLKSKDGEKKGASEHLAKTEAIKKLAKKDK